jgi:hypothetical protein
MKKLTGILNSSWGVFIILLLLIGINIFTSIWHSRIDLTDEKRFTLSDGTIKLLKGLDETVTIDVFLKGNYPSGFKKLAAATEDMLSAFKEVAGVNISYRFIAPEDMVEGTDISYADTLTSLGIVPINLTAQLKDGQQQQKVFPFALIKYKNNSLPIEIYKGKTPIINVKEVNNAEALLEYQFANGIARIQKNERPYIGYATGNGEPMDYSVYDLAEQTLNIDYKLTLVNITQEPFIDNNIKALIILKPVTAFSDIEKLKLDQYVMNGGKLLFFIDRLNAEMDSLKIKNEVIAYDRDLQLNDFIFHYGVRINPDLLMDLQCDYLPFDVNGNGQFEFLPWNYFPVLESSDNHPINKNLGYVSGKFVNTIDLIESEGIKKTVLLQSSPNARTIASPALISGNENVTAPKDNQYNKAAIPVAVLLEGKFTSLYTNRLSAIMQDSLRFNNKNFVNTCKEENKMLIVSDADIIMNSIVKGNQPINMGMNPFTIGTQREFPFANKEFLLNSLDYLLNVNDLSEANSKDYTVKFLDTKKVNSQRTFWQFFNIILPVILIIIFALIFQFLRKKKYAY